MGCSNQIVERKGGDLGAGAKLRKIRSWSTYEDNVRDITFSPSKKISSALERSQASERIDVDRVENRLTALLKKIQCDDQIRSFLCEKCSTIRT